MSSKTKSIIQKKVIRCINKAFHNAHTEPVFIRNKILKLDDLYKFELSTFMFDCINGLLVPTPILDYFTTNATIHAHHTRQRNIPHVTQTFGTISERAVTHKGPKTWTEILQTIRLHQNKNIFSRLLKKTIISPSTTKCFTYAYNCCELSLFYLSISAMHVCVVAVAVCIASRGGCDWVRLVRSCVCSLSWCPVCGHVPAGCVLLSPCSVRSLCFPESVSARMGNMPNQSVLCHVYCEYIIPTTIGTIISANYFVFT